MNVMILCDTLSIKLKMDFLNTQAKLRFGINKKARKAQRNI